MLFTYCSIIPVDNYLVQLGIPCEYAKFLLEAIEKYQELKDITVEEVEIPIGSWAGRAGEMVSPPFLEITSIKSL